MIQIGGKFQLLRNENFWEHLVALGIPEDRAKLVDALRPELDIVINGKEVTFAMNSGELKSTSTLIFDEEVDETIAVEMNIRSTATTKDNQIQINSYGSKGEVGTRLYEFYDTEMIMTLSSETPNVPVAKRYYKRLQG